MFPETWTTLPNIFAATATFFGALHIYLAGRGWPARRLAWLITFDQSACLMVGYLTDVWVAAFTAGLYTILAWFAAVQASPTPDTDTETP